MPRKPRKTEFRNYRLSGSPELLKQAAERFAYVRKSDGTYYTVDASQDDIRMLHDFGIGTRPVYSSYASDVRRIRDLVGNG